MKWAIENSTDKEASKIYAKYVPHLEFAGHQVSYGATFNSQLKSKVIESCKQYGPPSGFLTVSFNDIDNPWNIWTCSQTSSNQSFPSGLTKIQVLATAQLSSCTTCEPVQCSACSGRVSNQESCCLCSREQVSHQLGLLLVDRCTTRTLLC